MKALSWLLLDSLIMGENCDIGEAPLKAPVGVGGLSGFGTKARSFEFTRVLSGEGCRSIGLRVLDQLPLSLGRCERGAAPRDPAMNGDSPLRGGPLDPCPATRPRVWSSDESCGRGIL